MSKRDSDKECVSDNVTWTSQKKVDRSANERRVKQDRRQLSGRTITVPDMRCNTNRRTGEERRKVRLTITGRALNI